jgi:probable F420-dependent oxidoreductase
MRIGLALPHYAYSLPAGQRQGWPALVDAARRAEGWGFDSVWASDHFFFDIARYGGPSGPQGTPELFTSLAGLAALTDRIRVGTLVACAPFRHPAHVAKMSAAIDLVSGGRFELAFGSGWYEAEFAAFGYAVPSVGERFSILEETVEVVAGLFGGGPFDFRGRHFQLAGAYNRPRPVQEDGPPIWIGSKGGPRSLRLAVRHAAGWNTVWKWTPRAYRERVLLLERICEEEGRDPATVRRSVGLYSLVGTDRSDLGSRFEALRAWTPGGVMDGVSLEEFASDTLTGTVEDCLERLAAFAELGVEEMVLSAASLPFAVADWSMVELIAEQLLPQARSL